MPGEVWDEITYPLPNFNGCTVEAWEWISNFFPHFIMNVIIYPSFVEHLNSQFPKQYIVSWNSMRQHSCDVILCNKMGVHDLVDMAKAWIYV